MKARRANPPRLRARHGAKIDPAAVTDVTTARIAAAGVRRIAAIAAHAGIVTAIATGTAIGTGIAIATTNAASARITPAAASRAMIREGIASGLPKRSGRRRQRQMPVLNSRGPKAMRSAAAGAAVAAVAVVAGRSPIVRTTRSRSHRAMAIPRRAAMGLRPPP